MGGVTALAAATLALTDPEAALFWTITGTVLATGTLWFLIGGILRSNAALREARAELAELAVAEEWLRFARDMHDLLGHDLSLIALKAELAGKLLPARADDAAAEVADIRSLSRSALTQVREAVDGYRRPTLPSELAGAKVALEAAGIELQVDGAGGPLDPETESVLAWAVREGATNVIRHSGASRARIRITAGAASAELEVSDDGRGAAGSNEDRERNAGSGRELGSNGALEPEGHGLAGLIERAHALGGTVRGRSGPGRRLPAAGERAGAGGRDRRVIRVLLAEDQAMVRGALVSLLGLEEDIEVVADVGSGEAVLDAAHRSGTEVALLDIGLPGIDGLEVAAALNEELPDVRVVMLTPSTVPATCAARWRRARRASSSRTRRPASWPERSGAPPPASGWLTPGWPPPR